MYRISERRVIATFYRSYLPAINSFTIAAAPLRFQFENIPIGKISISCEFYYFQLRCTYVQIMSYYNLQFEKQALTVVNSPFRYDSMMINNSIFHSGLFQLRITIVI